MKAFQYYEVALKLLRKLDKLVNRIIRGLNPSEEIIISSEEMQLIVISDIGLLIDRFPSKIV